ncbi:SDR family NAD(P)-dependent oxidoreductase [Nocardia speluncae]|uniref:SDR family NAD(P)-dependent oxidoreductase n=1 Tax=Nocardia speluncae TaxID=419477 RepID=A0A846XHA5_9NOCA|nr:SDR family NAD(P)-dependent oxidoreductase [Nocardia speluncae]NKY33254.1 SDR family NAD(P)-dependent oxidoreductase [Nocardia speluncae]
MTIPPTIERAGPGSRPTAEGVVSGADLTGRTCVITGASSGLGLESARVLARAGAHIVLTARRPGAADEAAAEIRREVPAARLSTVGLDLASLDGVRAAAARITELAPVIHVLMNNAGVMFTPFARTADGFELQFGTNHLGHFELTRLLLDRLRAAEGARIVNLASEGYRIADVDLTDPHWEKRDYDKFRAYGASKTANILHAVELDRLLRADGIRVCAVHPGRVATRLARHLTRADVAAIPVERAGPPRRPDPEPGVLTPQEGAATQVWAAVHPEPLGLDGVYFANCAAEPEIAGYAVDPERAAELWELSEQLCR